MILPDLEDYNRFVQLPAWPTVGVSIWIVAPAVLLVLL